MGDFYAVLAHHYDELFPLKDRTSAFVCSNLPGVPNAHHVLDIGCATGQMALYLAQQGYTVTAIDPDEKMVTLAWQRMANHPANDVSVVTAGMLDLDDIFPSMPFNSMLCLGNTLVHLQNVEEVREFAAMAYRHLTPNGRFILQIVNYTRILSQNITELPLIDRSAVALERRYRCSAGDKHIHFMTRLTRKEINETIENETTLLPLQWSQLQPIFTEAGFSPPQIFGDFNRSPFAPTSPALVAVF